MASERRTIPLTVRLTATYALLVAATLLVVAALAIQLTRSSLARSLDQGLVAAVESFRRGPAALVEDPEDLAPRARAWLQRTAFAGGQIVAVRTAAGDVLTSPGELDLATVQGSDDLLTAPSARWWDLQGEDGSVRALSVPLMIDGTQAGTIVAAASLSGEEATLSGLLSGIGWASGLGLAFATLLGLLAVRRTMRPLSRMSAAVEAIESTGDLSRRVRHHGPADEVGRLAEAFDAMLARLDEAFSSQRRFLSDASHELRTPLQVARGQLELLDEGLRGAEARRSLAVAAEELERMRRIVDDLLLLARLDEGMPLRREPVEVELVVREALLRGMLLARREHRVQVEPGLFAEADPDRLLQVLTNLVTNAVRHGGEDAEITITGRRIDGRAEIAISDTGPGIPEEEMAHVFDRLYRGHAARTGAPAGAGLGLAIVASLTKAMGGEVAAASEPGEGTTFAVRLPAPRADQPAPVG